MPNPNLFRRNYEEVRLMGAAADNSEVISVRCGVCGKKMNYLATDLVKIEGIGPQWPLDRSPFPCPKHGRENIRIKSWVPKAQDLGRVPIRRPVKQVWKWKTEMLGSKVELHGFSRDWVRKD